MYLVIQVYAPNTNDEYDVECFYDNLKNHPEVKQKKECPFHYRGLECKSMKSRDTRSNRQVWPWSTKWISTQAKRIFWRGHTHRKKRPLPTTQEKTLNMDNLRWSISKSRCKHKTRNYKTPRGEHRQNTLWYTSQQDPLWPTSQNIGNKSKSKQMGSN